jgi:chromosome segregation ATPase
MKTGSVAHKLGIKSPKTVISWTELFSEFFSDGAKGGNGLQRDYNHNDLAIINTIRVERQRDTEWEDIRRKLDSGYLESSLPLEATVIEGDNALAVYGQIKSLESALTVANAEIERLRIESKEEIERLRIESKEEIERIRAESKEEIERIYDENENTRLTYQQKEEQLLRQIKEREAELTGDIKDLNRELNELNREVGAWRARYDMLKERMEEDDK